MPRPEKVQAVAEIKERMEGARAVFLAEYAGLSVKDQQTLRRELRAQGAEFKVVKMTLARRAAAELDIDALDELLLGPTGLTFSDEDPVTAAKALKDFAKDHEVFVIKGGLLGGEFLTPETISKLADIEPRDVLLAKIAGAMKAPLANMAGLLAALPRNSASMFQQLLEKKEAGAPAAAAEESTDAEEATAEVAEDITEVVADDAATEEAPVAEATDASDEAEAPADVEDDAPEAPEAASSDDESSDDDESPDDEGGETEDDSEAKVQAESDDSAEASDDAEEE